MSAPRGSMLKATVLNMVVTLATAAMTLARSKVTAYYLGPEGIGVSALVNQWIQLFGVGAAMVTGPALIGFLSRKPEAQARRDVLRTAVAVIIAVNVGALAMAIPSELWVGGRGDTVPLLLLSGVTSTFNVLAQIPQAALIVEERLAQLTRLVLITTAISTTTMGLGTILGGLWGQFIGASIGAMATAAVLWFFGPAQVRPRELTNARFDPSFLRHALTLGATSLIAALASQAALTSIRVSIEKELGTASNGLFQAAWGLNAMAFTALTGGLANHAFPRFGAAPTPQALGEEMSISLHFILRLVAPVALIGLALHDLMIPILFSDRFVGAIGIVGLLICGNVPRAAAWVMSGPLLYRGRMRSFLFLEMVGAVALGVATPWLLSRYGLLTVGLVYVGNASLQLVLSSLTVASVEKVRLPWGGIALAGVLTVLSVGVLELTPQLPMVRWIALTLGVTLLGREAKSFLARRRATPPPAAPTTAETS